MNETIIGIGLILIIIGGAIWILEKEKKDALEINKKQEVKQWEKNQ